MHAARQVTCPKCGQADAVRKVSALIADGTWTRESAGLGLGIVRILLNLWLWPAAQYRVLNLPPS